MINTVRKGVSYPCVVLLRRKSAELATKSRQPAVAEPAAAGDSGQAPDTPEPTAGDAAVEEATAPDPGPPDSDPPAASPDGQDAAGAQPRQSGRLPRGYTPSKRELGKATPKRPSPQVRRPSATAPAGSRKQLTKEQKQELKEARRQRRREVSEGMRRGDPQYLPARDQGAERAIARDVVDSRRTVGTWFFAGALLVLLGSSATMPAQVQVVSTMLWTVLAVAVILDGFLLCRRVKRLVRERCPEALGRKRGLYLYTVMRSLTFRRMRVPLPRLKFGDPV